MRIPIVEQVQSRKKFTPRSGLCQVFEQHGTGDGDSCCIEACSKNASVVIEEINPNDSSFLTMLFCISVLMNHHFVNPY